MKIIFVLDNLYPNGRASAARVRCYGKGFRSCGIDVKVLLPVPRQVYSKSKINSKSHGIDQYGVEYKYMAGTCRRSKFRLFRIFQDLYGYSATLVSLIFASHKSDFIILYEGSTLWHRLCVADVHLVGGKVGIELNELPYGTGKETLEAQKKRKKFIAKVFPKLDFVLAISESLYELSKKYAPQATIIKVPIIVEGQLSGESFSEHYTPYLFHSGSLYEQKDGICGMLEAFGIAVQRINTPLDYILTGNLEKSPHAKELKEIINKFNIENRVKFVGYIDIKTLRKYQKNCALTIINKYDTLQNKYCFSTKLGEYLSFARPVITTTVGEANNYLKDGINAYIVEPNRPDLIADKIVFIIEHPEEAQKVGEAGHELVLKDFDCVYQAKRIIDTLGKINQ